MTVTFDQALEAYFADIEPTLNPKSYKHYKKRLRPFVREYGQRFLTELAAPEIVSTMTRINQWADGHKKANDTIRSNIMGWEQLQSWLLDNDYVGQLITPKKFEKPPGVKRYDLPTLEETQIILNGSRDDFRMIYRALRLTGARPCELCKAHISHIDRAVNEIVLTEHKTAKQTGKPRRIAIGHPALIDIIDRCTWKRKFGPIWLRRTGVQWRTEYASDDFRKARDAAGLRKCLVLYLARHEHATTLYRESQDLKCVADALGHTNLNTTMRYTRVESEQLKKNQCLFNEGLS